MDFDVKFCFDDNPPRMKEEVRDHALRTAALLVQRIIFHANELRVERLLPRHVRLIVFDITQDPVVRLNRGIVVTQTNRIRSMSKLLQRALDAALDASERDPKYGMIDKRLVRSCATMLEAASVRSSSAAVVHVAALVAEFTGIVRSSAHACLLDSHRTLGLDAVRAMRYKLSNGQIVNNISLHRLAHSIERTPHMLRAAALEEESEAIAAPPPRPCSTKRSESSARGGARRMEDRTVTFATAARERPRPATPSDCFWEEDDAA